MNYELLEDDPGGLGMNMGRMETHGMELVRLLAREKSALSNNPTQCGLGNMCFGNMWNQV